MKVAKKLGTTQAAVSQYLNSKRGCKETFGSTEYVNFIKLESEKIAKLIATTDIGSEEFKDSVCDLCNKLEDSNLIS